jgi:hypothetical protein
MKKLAAILTNKEIVNRIFFVVMILFVFRIGAAITVPGVTVQDVDFQTNNALSLLNLLGGGALQSFSVFALGVSPYITSSIIVQLLGMDVLPALTELSKQGQSGRKKMEMTTRYLTLLLGAVQAYGIVRTMETSSFITLNDTSFWSYAYIVTGLLAMAGAMHAGTYRVSRIYAGLTTLAALVGAGIAARQVWLQHNPPAVSECGADLEFMLESFPLTQALPMVFRGTGDCSKVDWTLLGFSIAELSLAAFAVLAACALALAADRYAGRH